MQELLVTTVVNLAELPIKNGIDFNIWLWLLPFAGPVIVLYCGSSLTKLSRTLILIGAIGLTYLLLNLALHAARALDWLAYDLCQQTSVHPPESVQMSNECGPHINTADGAKKVFALLFGWIPAAIYIGIWAVLKRLAI